MLKLNDVVKVSAKKPLEAKSLNFRSKRSVSGNFFYSFLFMMSEQISLIWSSHPQKSPPKPSVYKRKDNEKNVGFQGVGS